MRYNEEILAMHDYLDPNFSNKYKINPESNPEN